VNRFWQCRYLKLGLCAVILRFLLMGSAAHAEPDRSAEYRARLEALSEQPADARWKFFSSPYFRTNESRLNELYSRFDHAGGVIVGVGFQQNLSLLVHAQPDLCVIVDINPGVTEILVPFFGRLMEDASSRRQLVSRLLGVDVTEEDLQSLLEPRRQTGQSTAELKGLLAETAARLIARTPRPARQQRIAELAAKLDAGWIAGNPNAEARRAAIRQWFEFLDDEYLTGEFFHDAAYASWTAANAAERQRLSGWLSTEANYRMARDYWVHGKIVGITGDIGGASVHRLAEWLRSLGKTVAGLYLSNVGMSVRGHEDPLYFLKLYRTLGELPLAPDSPTLVAHGGRLTGFVRTYSEALRLYGTLESSNHDVLSELVELPLERASWSEPNEPLRTLRIETAKLLAKRGTSISGYAQLFDLLDRDRPAGEKEFAAWVHDKLPGLPQDSDIFRAITLTLSESGFWRSP
jgi:hypothetical protein